MRACSSHSLLGLGSGDPARESPVVRFHFLNEAASPLTPVRWGHHGSEAWIGQATHPTGQGCDPSCLALCPLVTGQPTRGSWAGEEGVPREGICESAFGGEGKLQQLSFIKFDKRFLNITALSPKIVTLNK